MGLIGGIAGGLTSAIGGIFAGSALNEGFKKLQKMYEDRLTDVKAHRDKLYYQDPTQSAENQEAVTQAQQLLNQQTERAKDTGIVSGGTDESVALQKQAAAAAVGNMMQQQAVEGASKKENIWNTADSKIDAFTQYLAESKLQQAQGKAQAIQGAANGLANAANSLPW